MANAAVRRGRCLPVESSNNVTRRTPVDGAAVGPEVVAGYETPRRFGLTRTKAESFLKQ